MRLAEIEPRHLKEYAAREAARGLAPNSVRLSLAPVRALLATAFEEGLIRSNPAAGLRIAQRVAEDADGERAKALTEGELRRLLAEIPAEHRLFFEFLASTGLRIGEAVAVRWGDLDLGRRRVLVRRRLYRGAYAPPKSRYGRRDVPLSTDLARALWAARKERGAVAEDEVVFPSSAGTPLDADNLRSGVLKPAARRAGVGWAGFHTLRHTCATLLFRRGWNPAQVQRVLGHHSPAFTLATYVHLLPDDLPVPAFFDDLFDSVASGDREEGSEALEPRGREHRDLLTRARAQPLQSLAMASRSRSRNGTSGSTSSGKRTAKYSCFRPRSRQLSTS
jgi:integrase